MRTGGIEATAAEWAALCDELDGADFRVDDDMPDDLTEDLLLPSEELRRVSNRIAGQYAEVVASFASRAFAGQTSSAAVDQVVAAIDSLRRLADAAESSLQLTLLREVDDLVRPVATGRRNSRDRRRALARLRDWIPRFARSLDDEDGARLRRLVEWKDDEAPLLQELASINGIGPKRLRSLYAAGLYRVEVVARATPVEVAQVTGLPSGLAAEVVAATRTYAVRERRRCLETLRDRSRRLRAVLESIPDDLDDADLDELAAEALHELELTLPHLREMP